MLMKENAKFLLSYQKKSISSRASFILTKPNFCKAILHRISVYIVSIILNIHMLFRQRKYFIGLA